VLSEKSGSLAFAFREERKKASQERFNVVQQGA